MKAPRCSTARRAVTSQGSFCRDVMGVSHRKIPPMVLGAALTVALCHQALAQTPASPPPPPAPPGYKLVPIAEPPPAQTRYEVEYSQNTGDLPPGMELPYDDGQPIPRGYRLVKQARRGLVISGSIVTGVLWALSVTGATTANYHDQSG